MSDRYILEGKETVLEPDIIKWAQWYETTDRKVAKDQIGIIEVSTVFLALDHSWESGPPLLFETMIFGGERNGEDDYQERCSTWEEAQEMHQRAIEWVKDRVREEK